MKLVTLELRPDGLYDATGLMLFPGNTLVPFDEDKGERTIELIKLGVSTEDILTLRNRDLI